MQFLTRFIREPLVHFLILGALLFGLFQAVSASDDIEISERVIRVTETDIDRMRTRFQAVWTRPPTEQELGNLIDAFVREEVFVREAIALSLDRDDTIIRQRLSQKMEFLLQSIAGMKEPTDEELLRQFEQDIQIYSEAPRYALLQVYLGQDAAAEADVAALLEQLRGGSDHTQIGQRSLLPMTLPLTSSRELDARFGEGFATNLGVLSQGEWTGPVSSGFGQHLIKVVDIMQHAPVDFLDVRERVEVSWRRDHLEAATTAQFEALAENYRIERDVPEDAQ